MHQPDYRDAEAGRSLLPWVRLHGVKDYLDMVTILDDFPNVKQNFNLVPSLLDQLQGYVDGTLTDKALELTIKKADALSVADRIFILNSFFHAHWDNMVKPYPRYWELLKMRGFHLASENYEVTLNEVQRYFSAQDFLDLQIWYNLIWIDPVFRKQYKLLPELIRRGKNFTETDKVALLNIQQQILSEIIPAYRQRQESGRIEISTTPYYHPILPLLYDTNLAAISQPHDPLPSLRFAHPEDVSAQIDKAVKQYEFYFGKPPVGMWPSEGSVCQEIMPIIKQAGIEWIATDEGILANSIGREVERNAAEIVKDPAAWYQAYQVNAGDDRRIDVIFRDHLLSDLIGFVYSHWNEQQAVDDFIRRLQDIKFAMGGRSKDRAVAVILDGENAWEHYPEDGTPFLKELYGRLNDSPDFSAVTISDYLKQRSEPAPQIKKIYPGSWINRNFRIWIGHQEDNLAWDYLGQARRELVIFEQQFKEKIKTDRSLKALVAKAWEHIYIAEGSDWCWWYGDDHSSDNDIDFDKLFRQHLITVYKCIDANIPEYLHRSIIQADKILSPINEITAFINPVIDGEMGNYYEWQGAIAYDVAQFGGAMHRSEYLVEEIFYGADRENFFIRIDVERKLLLKDNYTIDLNIVNGRQNKLHCQIYSPDGKRGGLVLKYEDLQNQKNCLIKESDAGEAPAHFAAASIIELALSFAGLTLNPGDDLNFSICLNRQGHEVQRIPASGYLHLIVPDPDLENRMWYV